MNRAIKLLQDGFEVKIGNGESSFWYCPWVMKTKLCDIVPYVDIHDTHYKIKDVWNGASWDLLKLFTNLPLDIKISIQQLDPLLVVDIP